MKKIFASVTLAAFMLVGATAFAYTQDPPPAADAAKKKSAPKKKKNLTAKTDTAPAKDAAAKPTPAPKAAPKKK
jgi:hypothetical protein